MPAPSHAHRLALGVALAVTVACAGSILPWHASAEPLYVDVSTGIALVPDQDISGGGLSGEVSLDPGFVVGGALGARLTQRFRVEASLSYRRAAIDTLEAPGVVLEGAGDVGVLAAMANAYVDLLVESPIRPYLGAGLGVGVVEVDSDADASALVVDDTSVELAWNILAGVRVPLSDALALSAGYRYLATTEAELDATLVGVGRGTVDGEFDVHELTVGLSVSF